MPSSKVSDTSVSAHNASHRHDESAVCFFSDDRHVAKLMLAAKIWRLAFPTLLQGHTWASTLFLSYSALGVIYGDIGTSPLYTFSSIFSNEETLEEEDVLMGVSLIFWAITLVVLFKYVLVVLHANDNGEGSTFALYSNLCVVLGLQPKGGAVEQQEHKQLLRISRKATLNRMSRVSSKVVGSEVMARAASNTLSQQQHADGHSHLHPDKQPEDSNLSAQRMRQPIWKWAAFPAEPVKRFFQRSTFAQNVLLAITIIAPAMEMGDGVLTPAISVVSAVSGLQVGASGVSQDVVLGVSVAILVLLFSIQFKGTGSVAFLFSPIVSAWLLCNGIIGIYNLTMHDAQAFKGLNPYYIYRFFVKFGRQGWEMLGSVMLSVTGAEAMFSDLGHFSIGAVVISWTMYAYPLLILTYLGQAAYLLSHPDHISTVYWSAVPKPVFWPMLVLATLASVVASQALISACFQICKQSTELVEPIGIELSETNYATQARSLDFFPSVKIKHTSEGHEGQIYISSVNWALMVMSIVVVVGFKANSTNLGNAYGLTISMVMFCTTWLVALIMVTKWRLSAVLVLLFAGVFGLVDGAFVSSNFNKVPKGGWVAIAIAMGIALINFIWFLGQRRRLGVIASYEHTKVSELFTVVSPPTENRDVVGSDENRTINIQKAAADTASDPNERDHGVHGKRVQLAVPQTNIVSAFANNQADTMISLLRGDAKLALTFKPDKPLLTLPGIGLYHDFQSDTVPVVLKHFLRNVEAMHQVNVFVCVRHLPVPFVEEDDRLDVHVIPGLHNTYQAIASYGYMDVVRHGKEFVDGLMEALVALIDSNAQGITGPTDKSLETAPGLHHGEEDTNTQAGRPAILPGPSVEAPGMHAQDGNELQSIEIQVVSLPLAHAGRLQSLEVPFSPTKVQPDLSRLSRAIELTSLARGSKQTKGDVAQGATSALTPAEKEAAMRVTLLQSAAAAGVVYYFGRTRLRMQPGSSVLHDLFYDNLYKPLLLLSYAQNEDWEVPVNNMVELGMVLHI